MIYFLWADPFSQNLWKKYYKKISYYFTLLLRSDSGFVIFLVANLGREKLINPVITRLQLQQLTSISIQGFDQLMTEKLAINRGRTHSNYPLSSDAKFYFFFSKFQQIIRAERSSMSWLRVKQNASAVDESFLVFQTKSKASFLSASKQECSKPQDMFIDLSSKLKCPKNINISSQFISCCSTWTSL